MGAPGFEPQPDSTARTLSFLHLCRPPPQERWLGLGGQPPPRHSSHSSGRAAHCFSDLTCPVSLLSGGTEDPGPIVEKVFPTGLCRL